MLKAIPFSLVIILFSCTSKKPSPNLIPISKLEKFASNTSQIVFDKEVTKLGYKYNQKVDDTTTGLSTFIYLEQEKKGDPKTMHSILFFAQKEKPVVGIQFSTKDDLEVYREDAKKLGYKEADEIVMRSKLGITYSNTSTKYYESAAFYFSTIETVEYAGVQVWRK
ncbi:MAG: hypothetical protein NTX03_09695 [Bacteroidetes bacterium]|nr:hypothetical protein [Bacteroidota bacterium]